MAPRSSSSFLLFFFVSFSCLFAQSEFDDHEALRRIRHEFAGRPWPERDLCHAPGVFCDQRSVDESRVLRVTGLVFEGRQLEGRLSPAIGQLSELTQLCLPNNQLLGQIPPQIMGCTMLRVLNLTSNRLSGQIPPEIGSLAQLRVLDLSHNMFEGDLAFLGSLHNLEKLNLADNLFAGKLPGSLRLSPNLRFIDVSGNSLVQDVSPNPLRVEPWLDTSVRRYVFSETSQDQKGNGNSKKKVFRWFLRFSTGILIGSGTGFVLCLILQLLVQSAKEHQKIDTSLKIFSTKIRNPEELAFLEREEDLASLQMIGRGACGEVYKATLPGNDRIEIAIKKIIQRPGDLGEIAEENSKLINKKLRQIRSEIRTMGMMRHPNLLPLLAYVPLPGCHYLVFEYMKNGSLQDYLQQGQKEFPWLQRYKVGLGIARGLEYLHKNSPRIIHRDLKPGNVLLDDNMEAKITDFGYAKALPDANSHASTSKVAGTVGYIAPEYYQTSKFTDKCDIYSFGVLLAVLVTGKFPSDEFFFYTDGIGLVGWMRNGLTSEDPKRIIDSRLLGNGHEEQMLLVLKVAFFCTLNDPKERPNSTDVRCMMHQIQH